MTAKRLILIAGIILMVVCGGLLVYSLTQPPVTKGQMPEIPPLGPPLGR